MPKNRNKFNLLRTIVLLVAILSYSAAYSQFNDTTHYHTAFLSSGSINKTNDGTAYLLNNVFKVNVKKKSVSLNFTNNWIYGKQNGNVSNNDFSTALVFTCIKHSLTFFTGDWPITIPVIR